MVLTYELQVTICTYAPLNETTFQRFPNAKLHLLTEEEVAYNYSASYRAYGCSAAVDTLERIKVEFEAVSSSLKHPMHAYLEPLALTTLPLGTGGHLLRAGAVCPRADQRCCRRLPRPLLAGAVALLLEHLFM